MKLMSHTLAIETKRTQHAHITRKIGICGGEPILDGTRTPVRSIVLYYKMGLSVDEILYNLPYLTPAQVHDALAYYYDNTEEIDKYIKMNSENEVKKKYPQEKLIWKK